MNRPYIFFITPDVWRGIGLEDRLPDYSIICTSYDRIIPILRHQGATVFCLEEEIGDEAKTFSNSGKLLEHPQILSFIKRRAKNIPAIMFFKPSLKLDMLIKRYAFKAIGNPVALNEEFENKISFYEIARSLFPEMVVPSRIGKLSSFTFSGIAGFYKSPFVIQFGHGWAGNTTFIIHNEEEFLSLVSRFPYTNVKVSLFIEGCTILNNCCVYKEDVLVSVPAIQISGLRDLSTNPAATCGRQWPVPNREEEMKKTVKTLSQTVGIMLQKKGYKGIFGLDFLFEKKTGRLYLSELNARMTASIPFYTRLERGIGIVPLLYYHLCSFLPLKDIPPKHDDSNIAGSQLIFRNKKTVDAIPLSREYGVYNIKKELSEEQGYYPESLSQDEYIFLKKRRTGEQTEYARLESKRNVLHAGEKLESWVTSLWENSI